MHPRSRWRTALSTASRIGIAAMAASMAVALGLFYADSISAGILD